MRVQKLVEAFSPSMPKWLKQFILWNPASAKKGLSKYADLDYLGLKGNTDRDTGRDENPLSSTIMRSRNVFGDKLDFSRATFIEQPVPNKIDDPIFSDTDKLCFVYLKSAIDSTVWIPRYSPMKERFTFIDDKGKEKTIPLDALNSKLLRQLGAGFCYIDLTDKNNFTGERIDSRAVAKQGSVDRKLTDPKEIEKYNRYTWGNKLDKSGYEKIPVTKRYEDKLRELKIKGAPEELKRVRNDLVKIDKDIADVRYNILFMDDPISYRGRADFSSMQSAVQEAYSNSTEAVGYLREALSYLNNFTKDPNNTYSYRKYIEYLNTTKKKINQANQALKPYVLSSIDWNQDDDSIYTDLDIDDNF